MLPSTSSNLTPAAAAAAAAAAVAAGTRPASTPAPGSSSSSSSSNNLAAELSVSTTTITTTTNSTSTTNITTATNTASGPIPSTSTGGTSADGATAARPIYSPAAAASDSGTPGLPPTPDALPNSYKRGLSQDAQSSPGESSAHGGSSSNALPQDQRTKKRRTGPGSRGVASLTPEQLAKKRANDREAQRAIRERTKNQIEAFENRIRELTSQDPYQELQKVIRQKEAVEAENAELRASMASIVAMIQPFLSTNRPSAEGAYISPVPTYASMQSAQQQQQQHHQQAQHQQHLQQQQQQVQAQSLSYSAHSISTPGSVVSPHSGIESPWQGQALSQASSHRQPDTSDLKLPQQRQDTTNINNITNLTNFAPYLDLGGGEHLRFDFLVDPSQRLNRMPTSLSSSGQESPTYLQLPLKHAWPTDANAAYCASTANSRASSSPPPQAQAQYQQQQAYHSPQSLEYANAPRPLWLTGGAFIKHCPPVCMLDSILLDFLRERRLRAAEGVPQYELVGPRYPSVSSLLNPAISSHTLHPLSKVFTDVLMAFPTICGLPEKVAVLYVMFMVMRWQISPTDENYELIPPFSRPLPSQFQHPHPAWVDHIPFPAMREKMVREYAAPEHNFDSFVLPYTTTLSLNWPYEETDALLETPEGREIIINPVFQRHICRPENWTLGDAFDKAFPSLRGTYNLKSERDNMGIDG